MKFRITKNTFDSIDEARAYVKFAINDPALRTNEDGEDIAADDIDGDCARYVFGGRKLAIYDKANVALVVIDRNKVGTLFIDDEPVASGIRSALSENSVERSGYIRDLLLADTNFGFVTLADALEGKDGCVDLSRMDGTIIARELKNEDAVKFFGKNIVVDICDLSKSGNNSMRRAVWIV